MHDDAKKAPPERLRDPASRAELARLERVREIPRCDLVLVPGIGGTRAVDAELAQRRTARIDDLRARLDAASGRASTDFALGQVRDRARCDFDRSR